MKTQYDGRIRTVTLENLRAMCKRASGMCHRYEISKVSRSRVHVEYSNPDEWGNSRPLTAIFPSLPGFDTDPDNPLVLIGHMLRTVGGSYPDYDWQSFDTITAGDVLHRSGFDGPWRTRREVDGTDRYLCPDDKVRTVDYIHPYTNETFAAFDVTAETSPEAMIRTGITRHYVYYAWSDLRPVKE